MFYNIIFWRVIGLLALTLLLSNCTVITKPVGNQVLPVWPKLPDPTAFKYIMTIRENKDVVKMTDQDYKNLLVGKVAQLIKIDDGYGVAARQGTILVTDREKNIVHAFNIPQRKYFAFGYRLEGKLGKPLGIDMDQQSNAYVADLKYKRVVKYDNLGLFQRFFGEQDNFFKLTDVAVSDDGGLIVAVDTGSLENSAHRFIIYDADGNKLREVGKRGSGDGEFNLPIASTIGPDNTIYIVDAGNFRVQAFSPAGEFLFAFGSAGNGSGQFSRPKAITTDRIGNVYVTDANFGNVQVFNNKGQFLLAIGERSFVDKPGGYNLPIGIAVDEQDYLYIVDGIYDKLDVIKKVIKE